MIRCFNSCEIGVNILYWVILRFVYGYIDSRAGSRWGTTGIHRGPVFKKGSRMKTKIVNKKFFYILRLVINLILLYSPVFITQRTTCIYIFLNKYYTIGVRFCKVLDKVKNFDDFFILFCLVRSKFSCCFTSKIFHRQTFYFVLLDRILSKKKKKKIK